MAPEDIHESPAPPRPKAGEVWPLWPASLQERERSPDGFTPYLEWHLGDPDASRGMVLILPGGGYQRRADHEGAPIARRFRDQGFHAAVLHYRVKPARHPAPWRDATRAVRLLRSCADVFGHRADAVAILGFSAGGHLATSACVLPEDEATTPDPLTGIWPGRPDAGILCYPVILWGEGAHRGSFDALLGPEASEADRARLSLDRRVDARTPPCFLWHTAPDPAVPAVNSIRFAQALWAAGRPAELHVFPDGGHGIGEAPALGAAAWPDLAATWLRRLGW